MCSLEINAIAPVKSSVFGVKNVHTYISLNTLSVLSLFGSILDVSLLILNMQSACIVLEGFAFSFNDFETNVF